jgi:CRP/FNR family transcriptional regulator, cyclic AMP receptor protein
MADKELVSTLKRVPLFARLSDRDLKRLANSLSERTFPAGHEIAIEGSEGVGFFVIESGEVSVSRGGEHIRKLGPGDYFGEMSVIDQRPRSATVVADTELRCRGMTSWAFKPFLESHGEVAWPLLEALVTRLREAEDKAE